MVTQRISLLTIGAYDLPALRTFYQSLGWEETEISSDKYAVFNLDYSQRFRNPIFLEKRSNSFSFLSLRRLLL
jgi:hypothetical protein